MKKIQFLFIVIAVLLSTAQIVKAQADSTKVTTLDATLKLQGTQNEASTMEWLQSDKPSPALINMPMSSFNQEFKSSLSQLNKKYGTFSSINSDVINDEIVPNLYTAELDPNKIYRFSRYDLKTKKWGSWLRKAKKGETGLFYPDWEEPVMSVFCWNFGYPNNNKVVVPKVEKPEVEYVYIPGSKKVIEYGADTVETTRTKVIIENNNSKFASYNQSYEVNVDQNVQRQEQTCSCPQVQQKQITYAVQQEQPCGCAKDRICYDDYQKLPKHRKPLGQRTWFKVGTHLVAFAAGWFGRGWLDRDHESTVLSGVTQGPLELLPSTTPIYTQGPLYQ